jgi:hypothetical protein
LGKLKYSFFVIQMPIFHVLPVKVLHSQIKMTKCWIIWEVKNRGKEPELGQMEEANGMGQNRRITSKDQ